MLRVVWSCNSDSRLCESWVPQRRMIFSLGRDRSAGLPELCLIKSVFWLIPYRTAYPRSESHLGRVLRAKMNRRWQKEVVTQPERGS
jgi:hypothetical protein